MIEDEVSVCREHERCEAARVLGRIVVDMVHKLGRCLDSREERRVQLVAILEAVRAELDDEDTDTE